MLKEISIFIFWYGSERGEDIILEEIYPFTFFSYLNKFHSDKRRVEILQDLRCKLHFRCSKPTDVSGIPTTYPMKVHLFPHKSIRNKHDINVLWKLFEQVKEGKIDERFFQTALNLNVSERESSVLFNSTLIRENMFLWIPTLHRI